MTIYTRPNISLEYLAYTYLIGWSPEQTGLDHWVFYYGSKYGQGAHPDLFWIDYWTSSTHVADFRATHGEPAVKKIKKKFYGLPHCKETGDIVVVYESRVLTRINAAVRPDFLNKSNGRGKFSTAGMMATKDAAGKVHHVAVDDPRIGISLFHITSGMMAAKDSEGNTYHIATDDPRYLNGDLVHVAKGTVPVKDSFGQVMKVSVDDPRYLNGDLVHNAKGTITVKDSFGQVMNVSVDDPRYLNGDLIHILKGINKKMVTVKCRDGKTSKVSVDDPRYLNGDLVHVAKGTITVKDSTGKIMQVNKDDPRYLNGDLVGVATGVNLGTATVKDGFGNTYQVVKDDPLIGVTLVGIASKKIFATINATGERIHASPKDVRWATNEIRRGW